MKKLVVSALTIGLLVAFTDDASAQAPAKGVAKGKARRGIRGRRMMRGKMRGKMRGRVAFRRGRRVGLRMARRRMVNRRRFFQRTSLWSMVRRGIIGKEVLEGVRAKQQEVVKAQIEAFKAVQASGKIKGKWLANRLKHFEKVLTNLQKPLNIKVIPQGATPPAAAPAAPAAAPEPAPAAPPAPAAGGEAAPPAPAAGGEAAPPAAEAPAAEGGAAPPAAEGGGGE